MTFTEVKVDWTPEQRDHWAAQDNAHWLRWTVFWSVLWLRSKSSVGCIAYHTLDNALEIMAIEAHMEVQNADPAL